MPLQRDPGSGSLLLDDGISLQNECCCEEAPPAPCSCEEWRTPNPDPGPPFLTTGLQVSPVGASFPNCPSDCDQFTVEPAWDGVIPLIAACDGETISFGQHLNGNLITASLTLQTMIPCHWEIRISCIGGFWLYTKDTGLSPVGTYVLDGSSTACAGAPATISATAYPV